jgi:hypothetical protein
VRQRYFHLPHGLGIGLTLAEQAELQCGGRPYLYELNSGKNTTAVLAQTGRRVVAEPAGQKFA